MSKIFLKKAQWPDVDLLFAWTNDNEVRSNSFNSTPIEYENHKKWFGDCIKNENADIYICYSDNDPVGQVRLNYEDDRAVISYSISCKYRGKGFGKIIIKLIEAEVISNHPVINCLVGSVKTSNIASQKIFEYLEYEKYLVTTDSEHFDYIKKINRAK